MRRLTSWLLLAVLTAGMFLFPACGRGEPEEPDRTYDEPEVLEAAATLLSSVGEVNDIFYGKGIPAREVGGVSYGSYREADRDTCAVLAVSSVEDIKQRARRVYSTKMCDWMFSTVLSPVYEDGILLSASRYIDRVGTDPDGNPLITLLMVNTTVTPLTTDRVQYLTDTLRVDHVKGQVLYLTVDCRITTEEGESEVRSQTFQLIEEEAGFRLHSPTYMKYRGDATT